MLHLPFVMVVNIGPNWLTDRLETRSNSPQHQGAGGCAAWDAASTARK